MTAPSLPAPGVPAPGGAAPVEVELKYRVADPVAAARFLDADDLAGFSPRSEVESIVVADRYLDTADGALAASGHAVRIRVEADGILVTVKSTPTAVGGGATHRRLELEGPASAVPDPESWPPSAARDLLLELTGGEPLVELVTVRQHRRRRLMGRGGATIELSLDEVEAVHGDVVAGRFTELEAELKDGEAADLEDLDRLLAAEPGLRPARGSKLARALAAVRRADRRGRRTAARPAIAAGVEGRPRLEVGRTPGVLATDAVAEAGRKVLRFHLARMIAREPGVREGTDAEEVHAMRVATRRQRAAWRIFGSAFRTGRTRAYRRELRNVAARLGAVRDLDVLLEGGAAYLDELPESERPGLAPLLAAWRGHRDDARALLIRALDAPAYARWLEDYAEFVRHEGTGARPVGVATPHRVSDTAASRILAAYERVRAYGPVLRWADVETLHELRIAAKWLRYSLEFVREALGPGSDELIAAVTALQDHLGLMHDADVAGRLARDFLVDRAGDLEEAQAQVIGRYLIRRERDRDRLVRSVGPRWRSIAGPTFRRRLGRALAVL